MPVFLRGLALKNFRGIGYETQYMAPFKDLNFFIGTNNSGKSTVLNFISNFLHMDGEERFKFKNLPLDELDIHSPSDETPPAAKFALEVEQCVNSVLEYVHSPEVKASIAPLLEKIFNGLRAYDHVWLESDLPFRHETKIYIPQGIELAKILSDREWSYLHERLVRSQGGTLRQWIEITIDHIRRMIEVDLPQPVIIPAIREVGPPGQDLTGYSGKGIINKLFTLQSPDIDRREDKVKFDKINNFIKQVTGKSDVSIEVPHNLKHIVVHMDGRYLPLSSLGTGIHELVIIAVFCTICENQIVCIEEPELHLHPILQRKLLRYLIANTNNQYFIATHSPVFINTPESAIFHVTHDGTQTKITESVLRADKYRVCVDLGYRAADILQSNCIIWVEGPSERIYISFWIASINPLLKEGIHYSIMFYGGRLLSHLSANDKEVTDFISLRQLNRNVAIVMDSDKAHQSDQINATKLRIDSDFNDASGISWITAGREIENYIDYSVLQTALSQIHPMVYDRPIDDDPFGHAFYFHRAGGSAANPQIYVDADKVKLARKICEAPVNLDILDLRGRVEGLVRFIQTAND